MQLLKLGAEEKERAIISFVTYNYFMIVGEQQQDETKKRKQLLAQSVLRCKLQSTPCWMHITNLPNGKLGVVGTLIAVDSVLKIKIESISLKRTSYQILQVSFFIVVLVPEPFEPTVWQPLLPLPLMLFLQGAASSRLLTSTLLSFVCFLRFRTFNRHF